MGPPVKPEGERFLGGGGEEGCGGVWNVRVRFPRPLPPAAYSPHDLPPHGQPGRPDLGGRADARKAGREAAPWERGVRAFGRDAQVTGAHYMGGGVPNPVTP